MKLKNGIIYNSYEPLAELRKANLPIKISAKLSKTSKAILEQYKFIEEQRIELVKKYGEEKEGNFNVTDYASFFNDFNELLDMEEEIDVRVIDIDELPSDISISTEQYEALSFIFGE